MPTSRLVRIGLLAAVIGAFVTVSGFTDVVQSLTRSSKLQDRWPTPSTVVAVGDPDPPSPGMRVVRPLAAAALSDDDIVGHAVLAAKRKHQIDTEKATVHEGLFAHNDGEGGVEVPSPVCPASNASVYGVPVGRILSQANRTALARCQGLPRYQFQDCTGLLDCNGNAPEHNRWEERLVRDVDPIVAPMHGGVSARRMMHTAVQLSKLCAPLYYRQGKQWPNRTVVVELGSGNGALLSSVVPREPHIYGVGTDIAKALVAHGAQFFPHLAFHRAIGAPMVPTGIVSCVYSFAVAMYLSHDATCNHIAEGLRLLKPGGSMILHGLPKHLPKVGGWTVFRETLFVNGTSDFLPTCTWIGRLVARIDVLHRSDFDVYPAPQMLTVVIVRNHAPFHCDAEERRSDRHEREERFFAEEDQRRAQRGNVFADPMWYEKRIRSVMGV